MDIEKLLSKDFIILDGAFGTELQAKGFGNDELPELVSFSNPDVVREIHKSYVDAGADVVCSNTFGANRLKLAGSGKTVDEVVSRAVALAKEAVGAAVALDVGPLGRLIEPYGDLSFEDAYDMFAEVVTSGERAGADLIAIETMTDLYEMKAALLAAKEKTSLPVLCSVSFEKNGRTFTGCGVREAAITLPALGADIIGVNCSTGPDDLFETVGELLKYSSVPVSVKPNAGLPDPVTGKYSLGADDFAAFMAEYAKRGVKCLGGCCGTTPEYIEKTKKIIEGVRYKKPECDDTLTLCSFTECAASTRPLIVGERINPTGKKLMKEALQKEDFDYILSLAAEQTSSGADILDINVGLPGIDEVSMMVRAVKAVQGIVSAPIQIDSSSPEAVEAALRVCRGKPIVNSVNGSEKSLSEILPIVKKYGAAVVGLTLDDAGIPQSADERFAVAKKIVDRATAIGIPKRDIIIDCLTMTVSAEPTAALETLKALKKVKRELGVKTTLGVSNVSFGLPDRESVNRTFLVSALEAGLDFAIINPNLVSMTKSVKAHAVLTGIDTGAADYIKYCSGKENDAPAPGASVTLKSAVEGGMKSECARLTKELLYELSPIDIINTKLIPILDDVGDRFEKGTLYLPQLILAADTIGACFSVVKEAMRKDADGTVGDKIILATVKGDIHDIGKSIVKVLLENYGYDVIDLGRDVPPEKVVEAALRDDVKLVGLSALMTTTLGSMEKTIKLLKAEKPDCLVMVGGAVLTPEYAESIGADFYAKDAKGSVDIAKSVFK